MEENWKFVLLQTLTEETAELKEMLRLKDEKINQLEVSTKLSIIEEKIKLHT